jgi:Xaa-Pro aminopeptidase
MKHSPAEEIKDDTSKISSARNQALGSALAAGLKTQDQIEENETGPALVAKGALTQENPERFKENQRIRREKKMCWSPAEKARIRPAHKQEMNSMVRTQPKTKALATPSRANEEINS